MKGYERAWALTVTALTSILGLFLSAVLFLISLGVIVILARLLIKVVQNPGSFTPSSQVVTTIFLVIAGILAVLFLLAFGFAMLRVFSAVARKEPIQLLPDQRLLQGGPTHVVDSQRTGTDEQ